MDFKFYDENATDAITEGQLMVLTEGNRLYEQPDIQSKVVKELEAGSKVFVTQQGNEWCTVWYEGNSYYIQTASLFEQETTKELKEEMDELTAVSEQDMNLYLVEQSQKRTGLIWGSVTAVLILAILFVGMRNSIRQKAEVEGKEADN